MSDDYNIPCVLVPRDLLEKLQENTKESSKMDDELKCPYCGKVDDDYDDDMSDIGEYTWECSECEREYRVITEYIVCYDISKIDAKGDKNE